MLHKHQCLISIRIRKKILDTAVEEWRRRRVQAHRDKNTKPPSFHESPPIKGLILIYLTRGAIRCQHLMRGIFGFLKTQGLRLSSIIKYFTVMIRALDKNSSTITNRKNIYQRTQKKPPSAVQ